MGANWSGRTGNPYSALYQRVPITEDSHYGILTAGTDNLYYQAMEQVRLDSSLVKSSTEVLTDFIDGSGWELNADKVVNRYGETMQDILNSVAKDAAKYSGAFALHINYNGFGEGVELQFLPFMYVRQAIPSKTGAGRVTHCLVSDNWEQSTVKKELKPVRYPLLNPLTAQDETLRGGRGQILYFTGLENGLYPLVTFDSIIPTAVADASIAEWECGSITQGFHGAALVKYPAPINSEEEAAEIKSKVMEMLGSQSSGALVMSVDEAFTGDIIETVAGLDTDELFTSTLGSIRDRVTMVYQQPQALLGMSPENSVFTQLAFYEAYTIYNVITRNKRKAISRAVNKVTDLMGFKVGQIIENDLGVIPNFGQNGG
jgi:hypothetical protein